MTNSEKNSMNKIAAEYAAKQMNRRAALSTAGKAAAGIAAIAVIGGAAYAMSNQGAAPAAGPDRAAWRGCRAGSPARRRSAAAPSP